MAGIIIEVVALVVEAVRVVIAVEFSKADGDAY